MKRQTLSRLTSAILVVVVGMTLGHLVMPYSPGRGVGIQIGFYAVMLALGALRGARDATVQGVGGRARLNRAALWGVGSALLALAGYVAVHGWPGAAAG